MCCIILDYKVKLFGGKEIRFLDGRGPQRVTPFPTMLRPTSPEVSRLLTIWPRTWLWIRSKLPFDSTRRYSVNKLDFVHGSARYRCIWMKKAANPRDGVSELRKHSEPRTRHVVFQEERWGSSLSELRASNTVANTHSSIRRSKLLQRGTLPNSVRMSFSRCRWSPRSAC